MEKTWTSELPDHGKVIVIKGPQVGEIWCRFDIWFFLELYLEGVSCLRLSFFFFFFNLHNGDNSGHWRVKACEIAL